MDDEPAGGSAASARQKRRSRFGGFGPLLVIAGILALIAIATYSLP